MKKIFITCILFTVAITNLVFSVDSIAQCQPYLGQTPPGITPVKFAPNNSYIANDSWWWRSSPVFSPDGGEMYFVKYFPGTDTHEIWYTKCVSGQWIEPAKASFSTSAFDGNPMFAQSNDTLYFYSQRDGGFIFTVTRTETGWSEPGALNIPLPANSAGVTSFYITKNKNVYFAMLDSSLANPDIWSSADIYKTEFVNGQYTQPENIGLPINSNVGEVVGYVDPDEQFLIFESKRTDGFGWHDLYISKKNQEGTWNDPINLGSKINTAEEDGTPQISPDGKYFFFTTVKSGDWGYSPYWVKADVVTNLINDTLVTDVDGNVYHTVKIGTQIWMVENLKTTKYRNGDHVPNVTANALWSNITTGAYCNYNNNLSHAAIYGKLYNWYAVNDSRKIAPTGWHVATDAEWITLIENLGGINAAGGKLKETGSEHWLSPNTGATNEVGFTALPGGLRESNAPFLSIGFLGSWWSADYSNESDAWAFGIFSDATTVDRGGYYNKKIGFSVRCVKDSSPTSIKDNKEVPAQFNLFQNYPNPFNPSTTIKYELKTQSFVKLIITNILGEVVCNAINETQEAGIHEYNFNADNLSSGIYFYQLVAGKFREIKKMILLQ